MGTLGTIRDPTIKIKPSKIMMDFIYNIQPHMLSEAPPAIKNFSTKCGETSVLSISDIEWLQEYLQQSQSTCYLHELLKGCQIVLPEPEIIPRNPVLEERVQRLKQQQQLREYREMTKDIQGGSNKYRYEDSIAYQIKMINRQLIAVAQFVFSVAAGFVFGFLGIELAVGGLDFGFRLLLGVMCALIISLAEIYFLAKKLSEDYIEQPKEHKD